MAVLDVLTYPDPFLRRTVSPVTEITDNLLRLISDMTETMYSASGVGLAAPQVGADSQIVVYDITPRYVEDETEGEIRLNSERTPVVLINPVITAESGEMLSENEGCLSVPDFRSDVQRFAQVRVEAVDPSGNSVAIDATDFHAVVLQHEIDHLRGVLFIDRINPLKREMYKRRLKKKAKESA
jgi:peptide deformylase